MWGRSAVVSLNVKTLRGKTLKTINLRQRKTHLLLSYRFRCTPPRGTYKFLVFAKDLAGIRQTRVRSNKLAVKWKRSTDPS